MLMRRHHALPLLLLVLLAPLLWGQSNPEMKWVGTWSASPMLADGGFHVRPLTGVTLREIVHISVGGNQVRLRFTNEFGKDPLTIADAHVALSDHGASIREGTARPVTFGGASSVRIPPGAALLSDPVSISVAPFANLAVSFYLPPQVMRAETFHDFADQDNFVANGDVAGTTSLETPITLPSWYFFDGVEVPAKQGSRAIVAFGDSITDGAHSTRNANQRWPDILAARLQQDHSLGDVSVLNEGIGGNRVLNEGYGPSALSRFDRDVLAQDGVRYVIVLESINDIGHTARPQNPDDEITADQLELGLTRIADLAHQHGLKIFGATLTPYNGAGYFSEKGEEMRKTVNDWIRTSHTFDGVVDFDKMTSDPQNPGHFNPTYDSGDHLHPGDAGYKAMADGIDLNLFAK